MAEEIREVLSLLNEKLAGLFPYRLEMVTPGELKLLEKNARYMKAEQFQSLVENIKKDGNLSSLPLCYREKDGKLRVLSGNHRVQAGRQAGVEQILVMVVGDEKDSDARLAIQLSHNAIAGQDDLVILKELWESIGRIGLGYGQEPRGDQVRGHLRAAPAIQAGQFHVPARGDRGP